MTLDKRTREQLLAHCGEIHEDDCINPNKFFKPHKSSQKQNRKARQLCRQITETLDLVFTGDCHREFLQSLRVESVQPAPDSSRFLVTVRADLPRELYDRQIILTLLQEQAGRLRCEVASAITRKRAPVLVFQILAAAGVEEVAQ